MAESFPPRTDVAVEEDIASEERPAARDVPGRDALAFDMTGPPLDYVSVDEKREQSRMTDLTRLCPLCDRADWAQSIRRAQR